MKGLQQTHVAVCRLSLSLSLSPGVKTVGLAAKHAHNALNPPSSLCYVNPESMVISACVYIGANERAQI